MKLSTPAPIPFPPSPRHRGLQHERPESRPSRIGAAFGLLALACLPAALWAGGPPATVVDENNADWGFLEEIAGGRGFYSYGFATPPLGDGAAVLVVDGTGREILGSTLLTGTRLDEITSLAYWTYRAHPATGVIAPSLQLNVDYDLTDADESWQGRLVYEPYLETAGDAVETGEWQFWNAFADGNWWASGAPGNIACPQGMPCTFAEVISNFPDAGVHATLGGILLKAGGPWADGFVGAVDLLAVGTLADGQLAFDFETANGLFADGFESGMVSEWSSSSP